MLLRPYQGCDATYLRDIEIKSYTAPWAAPEFKKFGRFVRVGVADGKVVGYSVLQGSKILRFAITPNWRRMGLGTEMMKARMRDTKLTIVIPESNESGAFFLRENGFKVVNILKGAFNELGVTEDGFYFLWKKAWLGLESWEIPK